MRPASFDWKPCGIWSPIHMVTPKRSGSRFGQAATPLFQEHLFIEPNLPKALLHIRFSFVLTQDNLPGGHLNMSTKSFTSKLTDSIGRIVENVVIHPPVLSQWRVYRCPDCAFEYNELAGEPLLGIAPCTKMNNLRGRYRCPCSFTPFECFVLSQGGSCFP